MSDVRLDPRLPLRQAMDELTRAFSAIGIDEPRREARLLLLRGLGLDLASFLRRDDALLGEAAARLEALAARRLHREPLSRIFGERGFFGLDFVVSPAVLDPRPETEGLIEAVLADVATAGRLPERLEILDLGTGSGAILVALLTRLANARGIGIDLSGDAIEIAADNARRHGLAERATFVVGDLFAAVSGRFDIIVSNPPYIPSGEIDGLMPEVRLHDPRLALDGGADGLAFYRRIAERAAAHLRPDGLLALEIGLGQDESVQAILAACGWRLRRLCRDYAGINRIVLAEPAEPAPGGGLGR